MRVTLPRHVEPYLQQLLKEVGTADIGYVVAMVFDDHRRFLGGFRCPELKQLPTEIAQPTPTPSVEPPPTIETQTDSDFDSEILQALEAAD